MSLLGTVPIQHLQEPSPKLTPPKIYRVTIRIYTKSSLYVYDSPDQIPDWLNREVKIKALELTGFNRTIKKCCDSVPINVKRDTNIWYGDMAMFIFHNVILPE